MESFLELQKDTYNSLPSHNNKTRGPTVKYIERYKNIYANPVCFFKKRVDYSRKKVYDEKYRKELERRNSFTKFPSNLNHLINSLAKSGFYHVGKEGEQPDRVKCIFCQGTLHSWKKTDVSYKKHKKCFPTCPFILNLNVGNEPLKEESQKVPEVDMDLVNCPEDRVLYNVVKPDLTNHFDLTINCYDDCDWRETSFDAKWPQLKHLALYGSYVQERNNCPYIVCYRCHKSTELLSGAEHLNMKVFHKKTCTLISESSNEDISKTQSVEMTDEEIEARLDSRFVNKDQYKCKLFDNCFFLLSIDFHNCDEDSDDFDYIIDIYKNGGNCFFLVPTSDGFYKNRHDFKCTRDIYENGGNCFFLIPIRDRINKKPHASKCIREIYQNGGNCFFVLPIRDNFNENSDDSIGNINENDDNIWSITDSQIVKIDSDDEDPNYFKEITAQLPIDVKVVKTDWVYESIKNQYLADISHFGNAL